VLTNAAAPFPNPAHQTGRADFRHPAFRLASSQTHEAASRNGPANGTHPVRRRSVSSKTDGSPATAPCAAVSGSALPVPQHSSQAPQTLYTDSPVFPTPVDRTGARWLSSSRSVLPSPFSRRVGVHIVVFEACPNFTLVTARRIARPPCVDFVARFRPARLPEPAARQLSNLTINYSSGSFLRWYSAHLGHTRKRLLHNEDQQFTSQWSRPLACQISYGSASSRGPSGHPNCCTNMVFLVCARSRCCAAARVRTT